MQHARAHAHALKLLYTYALSAPYLISSLRPTSFSIQRYDRELWQNTVRAMKRIAEIKAKREHNFTRLNKERAELSQQQHELDVKEVEQNIDLLKTPSIAQKLSKQRVSVATTKMEN